MSAKTALTKQEIVGVFATLKLETAEEREAVLAQGRSATPIELIESQPVSTFLGTETEPLPERSSEHAGMERTT